MKYKRKSKKQRQQWWQDLSADEQARFIDKKVSAKGEYRIKRTKRWLKDNNLTFDCSVCIHHLTGSRADEKDLPQGCEYFEDLVARKTIPAKFVPYWIK